MRKWWFILVGLIPIVLGVAYAYPQLVKQVHMEVTVTTNNTYTPVTVVVNGINLNNKVSTLEDEYNQLYNTLMKTKIGVLDYIYFSQLEDKVIKAIHQKLIEALKNGNYTTVEKLLKDEYEVNQKSRMLLLHLLTYLTEQKYNEYPSLGWFDIYGNHRSFNPTDYYINPNFDFRITNCYSSLGQSVVVHGGSIKITGVLYLGGNTTNQRLIVKLVDPESGKKPQILVSSALGENMTGFNAKIEWLSPSYFVITINTTSMDLGQKEVILKFGEYKVATQFVVVPGVLNIQKFGEWYRVTTTYPRLELVYRDGTKTVTPVDGVMWVDGKNLIKIVGLVN